MAEHAPGATQGPAVRLPAAADEGPSAWVVYWRYLIFWLLFFGLIYLVSLYGIVAEA